jgi:putative heme transporter
MAPTSGTSTDERPRMTRRRLVIGFVITVFVGVGVALLVGRLAGFAELLDELRDAHPAWLAVCFGAEVVSFAGYLVAFRVCVTFGQGPRLSAWATFRLVMASLGATRIVAAGGAGGLAVTYWALRQAGEDQQRAVVRVLGFNTLLYAVFGFVAALSAALLLGGVGGEAPLSWTLTWLVVVLACGAGAFFVLRPRRFDRIVTVSGSAGWARRGLGLAVAGVDMVRQLAGHRGDRMRSLVGSAAWWAGDIACLWAGLHAFGVNIGAAELGLAYVTGYAATILPLPTGGVGGVDAAMTFALNALGVPLADALLGVVAYRLFAFWLPTLPGLVALATLPQLGRELRAQRDPS